MRTEKFKTLILVPLALALMLLVLVSALFIAANILTDLLYAWVDPRVRLK